MEVDEFKLLFTGPMGAGKTTAINAISDQPCVSTDVANTDLTQCDKATTTAALDYGYISLHDGNGVRLYGTPGQERFRFMWSILANNAAGVVLLLDGSHSQVMAHLDCYMAAFWSGGRLPMVIGVGRLDEQDHALLYDISARLEQQHYMAPVFAVDVRQRDDVVLLVDALLCLVEVSETGMMNE